MARAQIPRLAEYFYLVPTIGDNAVTVQADNTDARRVAKTFRVGARPADASGRATVWGSLVPTRRTALRWTDYVETVAASSDPAAAWLLRRSEYPDPDRFLFESMIVVQQPLPAIESFYDVDTTSITAEFPAGPNLTITRTGTSPRGITKPVTYHQITAHERGAYDIDLLIIIAVRKIIYINTANGNVISN